MNIDALNLHALVEEPDRLEKAIAEQQAASASNPETRALLESIYLEPDRARSFERFLNGLEFRTILKILDIFGVAKATPICELGGGPGFLSWALSKSGFTSLHLMEPNGLFNTGTGYLRSRQDAAAITVHNDLNAWHAGTQRFPVVITKNCIHHFKNIPMAAATIRRKMQSGGLWFAFRESYAETAQELYSSIQAHPFCQKYGLYEWWYPSWHYVESIEMAGFKTKAIVPWMYANNTLGAYQENPGGPEIESLTAQIDALLQRNPEATVTSYWQEVLRNRFQNGDTRLFSRPQLMVFAVSPV